MKQELKNKIINHYENNWGVSWGEKKWEKGPVLLSNKGFSVLEFPPNAFRKMWTYATCGMSQEIDSKKIEVHLFSPEKNSGNVELLTLISQFHSLEKKIDLNHTVNFGRPWLPNSNCSFGLISLPYLDGPALEFLDSGDEKINFYWLIPISGSEKNFAVEQEIEKLEELFEEKQFNYLNPFRESVV